MKMMLSTPSTISSAVSVKRAIHASGSVSQSNMSGMCGVPCGKAAVAANAPGEAINRP
jgi:hypothetical protein